MKRCIYHHPEPIQATTGVGSALRPAQMLAALKQAGYQVDEVTGYSKERKEKIKQVKQNIKNGVRYEFVYAENVNSPVAFTDADNLPRHPFMDFAFFTFCRKQGIPVGLFYRDIFWKFPLFKASAAWYKRMFLLPMYRRDLRRYAKCLSHLFLPSVEMAQQVGLSVPFSALPPGGRVLPEVLAQRQQQTRNDGTLRLFYVGSLSRMLYDNRALFEAVYRTENVYLTVCTHKDQWESLQDVYAPFLCDRIRIVHKASHQLAEEYLNADVATCCLEKSEYLDFAMPIKVFESISYATPLLVTKLDAMASFVEQEGTGWVTGNDWQSIQETLEYLLAHPEEVAQKTDNVIRAVPNHTWLARAKTAAETLESIRK